MSTALTKVSCPEVGPGAVTLHSSSQEEEHIRNTRIKAFSVGQDHPWQRIVPFTEGLVKSPTTLNNIDTYCLSNTLTSSDTLVTVFTA